MTRAHKCRLNRTQRSFWFRPQVVQLERRLTPATATLSAGTLTVDFTAKNNAPESVTITNDGVNITLAGNVNGATSSAVGSVMKIVVSDTSSGKNQDVTFDGTSPYSLSGGFSCTGVET